MDGVDIVDIRRKIRKMEKKQEGKSERFINFKYNKISPKICGHPPKHRLFGVCGVCGYKVKN